MNPQPPISPAITPEAPIQNQPSVTIPFRETDIAQYWLRLHTARGPAGRSRRRWRFLRAMLAIPLTMLTVVILLVPARSFVYGGERLLLAILTGLPALVLWYFVITRSDGSQERTQRRKAVQRAALIVQQPGYADTVTCTRTAAGLHLSTPHYDATYAADLTPIIKKATDGVEIVDINSNILFCPMHAFDSPRAADEFVAGARASTKNRVTNHSEHSPPAHPSAITTVRYTTSPEDYGAYFDEFLADPWRWSQPRWARAKPLRFALVTIAGCIALAVILNRANDIGEAGFAIAAGILLVWVIPFAVAAYRGFRWSPEDVVARQRAEFVNTSMRDDRARAGAVSISPHGITAEFPGLRFAAQWSGVDTVTTAETIIRIYFACNARIDIPRAAFESPEAFEAFGDTARSLQATAGHAPESRLRDYLAQRDTPCPLCKYNLRDLATTECPECSEPLLLHFPPGHTGPITPLHDLRSFGAIEPPATLR